MTLESTLRRLARQAHPAAVIAAGIVILAGVHATGNFLRARTIARQKDWAQLRNARERGLAVQAEFQALHDLKAHDIARLRNGLSKLTQSKRSLFEAGLDLQEERRLLEKQWEIMTTYLLVDVPNLKISVMRGDQALESFSISHASAAFGAGGKDLPLISQIISKERFAHPERGQSEEIDGHLVWTPPQVGTSVRANALGEYVLFSRGDLILHGPSKKKADHQSFPHWCAGLSASAARKLYHDTFIGTKIVFKKK